MPRDIAPIVLAFLTITAIVVLFVTQAKIITYQEQQEKLAEMQQKLNTDVVNNIKFLLQDPRSEHCIAALDQCNKLNETKGAGDDHEY